MSYHEIARAAHITQLEERVEKLVDDNEELQDKVDGLETQLTDVEVLADKRYDTIFDAITDLRSLSDVPLRDLTESIEILVENLQRAIY